jgi:AraC family transcriptional regulator of adaptative response / DNA-3-methyladenine glycosylase II
MFNEHLGVTPTQLAYSRRAHFARRLLDDSDLTVTEVAFASGYGSIRQFNRAMRDVFRSSPRDLRARRRRHDRIVADGGLMLRLPVDPPFDWDATLCLLELCAIPGVECVQAGTYRRTIMLDGDPGLLEIRSGGGDHLLLTAHLPYWEGLIHVVERATRMLGIDSDVAGPEARLAADPVLGPTIRRQAGMRIPGAWGPFEVAVQVLTSHALGYAPARTTLARIVRDHGTYIPGLPNGLAYAFPSAETLAEVTLSGSPLPRPAADAITALACAVVRNETVIDAAVAFEDLISSLTAIPGITASAAHMIALRLGHHDAFPHADRRISQALRAIASSPEPAGELAERWRPWRALAATHLLSVADRFVLASTEDQGSR